MKEGRPGTKQKSVGPKPNSKNMLQNKTSFVSCILTGEKQTKNSVDDKSWRPLTARDYVSRSRRRDLFCLGNRRNISASLTEKVIF